MQFHYIIAIFAATAVAMPHGVEKHEMNNAMTTSSSMTTPMSMPMKRTAEPSSQATPTPTSSMSPMRGAKLMMPYESHDQAF